CRFLFREKGTKVHDIAQDWLKNLPEREKMPTPIITGDMESIKNLALCGTGIAILPGCCAAREIEMGLLKEITLPVQLPSIEYFLIQRKNDRLSRTAALLLEELKGPAAPTSAGPEGEPCYQSAP
ncbi:MAG: hypothetical protein IKS68_03940, partial [Mailhella sp.]|nr:hypothetical protein [Mailhella sp.]